MFFFTSEVHKNYTLLTCQKVCEALTFLFDNIYIRFGTKLFRQTVSIPRVRIAHPLWLICSCFVMKEASGCPFPLKTNLVIEDFSSTPRYLDGLLILTIPTSTV